MKVLSKRYPGIDILFYRHNHNRHRYGVNTMPFFNRWFPGPFEFRHKSRRHKVPVRTPVNRFCSITWLNSFVPKQFFAHRQASLDRRRISANYFVFLSSNKAIRWYLISIGKPSGKQNAHKAVDSNMFNCGIQALIVTLG
jgi:hypothetical protein